MLANYYEIFAEKVLAVEDVVNKSVRFQDEKKNQC